jgi:outer membrane autotransporter protein
VRVYRNAELVMNSTLAASDTQVDQGGKLSGGGRITGSVVSAGTIAPGGGAGLGIPLTIDGSLTLASTSALEVHISGSGSGDRLVVGGAARLSGSVVVTPDSGITYRGGTTYTILTAGSLSGSFASLVVTDTSALGGYGLRLSSGASAVTLTVINQDFALLVPTGPGHVVGVTLDSTCGQLSALCGSLQVSDTTGLRTSLESMTGDRYAALGGLAARSGLAFLGAVRQGWQPNGGASVGGGEPPQLAASGDSIAEILAAADLLAAGPQVQQAGRPSGWIVPYGFIGSQDSHNGAAGYDFSAGGVALGGDVAVGETWRLGLTGGAGRSTADFAGAGGNAALELVTAGGYALWRDGPWQVDGIASASVGTVSAERSLTVSGSGQTASSDSTVWLAGASLGASYRSAWGGWTVTPNARLEAVRWHIDGFDESGSSANLTVADMDGGLLRARAGLAGGTELRVGDWRLHPELRLAAAYDWQLYGGDVTAHFTGTGIDMVSGGAQPSGIRALPGLGIAASLSDSLSLYAAYDGEFGAGLQVHTILAGMRVRW